MKGVPLYACAGCCILVWVVLGMLSLFVLDDLFTQVIKQNVVLHEETMGLWSEVPGDSKTVLTRNFTFYNFTNPDAYLFRNQLPKFTQITGYVIQEKSKFCNITYSEDRSKISYNYWLYFGDIQESKPLNETVNVLNLGPLGFWSQLNTVNSSVFAIQGLGQLFVQLNNTLSLQIIGQGVQQQFLTTYKQFQALCKQYQINQAQCLFIWQDPINGLSDSTNYQVWVNAGLKGDVGSQRYLRDYYPIQSSALQSLLNKISEWSKALQNIISNWYCDGHPCTNFELLTKQLSHSGVTNNPPPGTDPTDTICDQNETCQGYPQISSFTKHILGHQYLNITFSQQTFAHLLTPNKGLLHIGHLNTLFQWGNKYQSQQHQEQNVKPSYYLAKIQQFFQLQSQDHAYVFWKWIKYFTQQFVLKSHKNGSGKIAGMGAIFTQAFYETFTDFGSWIIAQYRSMLIAGHVKNCQNYMRLTFTQFTQATIKNLCANVDQKNYITYLPLIYPCLFGQEQILTPLQIGDYCDSESQSIGSLLHKIDQSISISYNCTAQSRCSGYQLAIKQFVNSTITLNPLYADQRKPAYSVNQWNKQFPAFEYKYFVKNIKNVSDAPQITLPWNKLYDLVSFDKLWSGPMIQNLLLSTNQQIIDQFYWPDPVMLKQYLRYIVINIGFGGLIQKRSPQQLLFGYKDQFLDNLKTMDPILGGDPSINSIVALNQPNITKEQAYSHPLQIQQMFTGIDNSDKVRIYSSINSLNYISYNRSWFDGDTVGWSLDNPHKRKVQLFGTDAFQSKPDYHIGDKCGIFIETLCRGGNMTYDKNVQLYDFKMYRLIADDEMFGSQYEYPQNQKYYQSLAGFFNQSYQGLPLFASLNHMYRAPKNWSQMIEVRNIYGDIQQPNEYDDAFLYIEPKTGTTFVAVLYLQTNLYLGSDVLLTQPLRMLPIFSVYRSGNISQQIANQYFGDVKFILGFSRSILLLAVIFISVCVIMVVGYRLGLQKQDVVEKKQSLLQSLEEQKKDQLVQ